MSKSELESSLSRTEDENQLLLLQSKRDALFARMQKIYDLVIKADGDEHKLSSLKLQVPNLETLSAKFEQTLDSFNKLQLKLSPSLPVTYQAWTVFEDMCCTVKQVLDVANKKSSDAETAKLNSFPTIKSRLPPLELLDFHGNSNDWSRFYLQFKSLIHENPNVSQNEKVFYLVSKLKGQAAAICAGLPTTPENYNIIWQALIEKYDDKRSLASSYLNQILNFKALTANNASGLESFLNNFNSAVEALKQLQLNDITDYIWLHLATQRLDSDTVKLFEITYRHEKIPSYSTLVQFVKEQSKVLSRGINTKSSDSKFTNKNLPKNSLSKALTKSFVSTEGSSTSNNKSDKCSLCNENKHEQFYKCSTFMKLSPRERFDAVKKNSYCVNCLSSRHGTLSLCNSKHNCSSCKQRHHSLLCFTKATQANCSFVVNNPATLPLTLHADSTSALHADSTSALRTASTSALPSKDKANVESNINCSAPLPSGSVQSAISGSVQSAISGSVQSAISATLPFDGRNIESCIDSSAPRYNNSIQSTYVATLPTMCVESPQLSVVENIESTDDSSELQRASLCTVNRDSHEHFAQTALLGTAQVKFIDKNNRTHILRCLVDPGSQSDYVTIECCKRLQLPVFAQNRFSEVQGIGGNCQRIIGISDLKFTSRFDDTSEYSIRPLVVKQITSQLPDQQVDVSALKSLIKDIPLADENFATPGNVDLLIGVQLYCDILLPNKITGSANLPCAVETALGYLIMGNAPIYFPLTHTSSFCARSNEPLDDLLEKFWKVEEPPAQKFLSPEEQECEDIYVATTTRNDDGSFAVDLPFKESPDKLGDSYIAAKKRYLMLEKKFGRAPDLRHKYNEVIRDYLDKGILSKVDSEECTSPGFYLPHRPVIRNDKETTKLRIVLDASMKSDNNVSLNDILHTGCNLQAEIFNILLNVRLFKIAFFADVRQMYLCIEVHPPHRKYQRIIYRFSPEDPLQIFEFNRVTFGLRSSPFLALRTLREVANQEKEKWPLAAEVVKRDVYMDDLASSAYSIEDAEKIAQQLILLFKSGGFDLVKWTSNSAELLEHIPKSHRQTESVAFDGDHTLKILGLHWLPASDEFCFKVSQLPEAYTKRAILSATARLYDVLGLVGPIILFAKLIMKELWLLKIKWDEVPPTHIVELWKKFLSELALLSKFKFPRHIGLGRNSKISLLAFADASEKAFGSVIYTHVTNGNVEPVVTLVCSKSRVSSPSKLVTLARLELNALVLLAKLVRNVYDTLSSRHDIDKVFVFSDSTVALCWLSASPHRFQTYVANRISQFQTLLSPDCLYHIPGIDNPADCISRGLLPSQLLDHEIWFKGPSWVSLPVEQWPVQKFKPSENSGLPEQKTSALLTQIVEENVLLTMSTRFSSWSKYLRAVVYLLRFIKKLPRRDEITAEDLNVAEMKVLAAVQDTYFAKDRANLEKGTLCSPAIQKLRPFIRDNLIHVGGRLSYSSLDYCHKHPILLPRKGHIIDLLIDYLHRENLHAGPQLLLSLTRQKYWILSARRIIKQRIFKCVRCFRLNPKATFPIMADLPPCRLEQSNAFTHTGVDYAGPLYVTLTRGRGVKKQKAYLCLFVCLVTKAICLDLAPDLSSASFLNAFKRFKSRAGGSCRYLYSDRGTNFVSSRGYLNDLHALLASDDYFKEFSQELAKCRIIWQLNPASASHMGGLWEANIKSTKTLLGRVIGNQILTYEEMLTVLAQVEAILNSRPLYVLSTDPSEPSALTPAHFLNKIPCEFLPAPNLSGERENLLSRYMLLDSLVQSFWKRFRIEYLHTLQMRQKWNTVSKPVDKGMIVLINTENAPPLQWPLGIITQVFPGRDGTTRVAEVRTKNGSYVRPIVKLCPLPID